MLFLLLCISLTDALQDRMVDVLTTYVCMYAFVCILTCILFKFYMRLMGFCAEDEVVVFPGLSHLQMKYIVPKICFVNLVTSTR